MVLHGSSRFKSWVHWLIGWYLHSFTFQRLTCPKWFDIWIYLNQFHNSPTHLQEEWQWPSHWIGCWVLSEFWYVYGLSQKSQREWTPSWFHCGMIWREDLNEKLIQSPWWIWNMWTIKMMPNLLSLQWNGQKFRRCSKNCVCFINKMVEIKKWMDVL